MNENTLYKENRQNERDGEEHAGDVMILLLYG